MKPIVTLILCLTLLILPVSATQVDCDAQYCFAPEDFATGEDPLRGICILSLPDPQTGTVLLGSRVLRPGDILTDTQVSQMTFQPLLTTRDQTAQVCYLPIYETRVEKSAVMTLSIRGKEDKAPVAEDSAIETYKNLPNQGRLKASDPEGKELTYSVVRSPKRGTVQLNPDGSFTYTPKKNKVGVDSFVYTATDPAGNVSRQATVTVQILKPTDSRQYQDTAGTDCRFEAEWLRNRGLFTGETVAGQLCFQPEQTVSRGEFLTMAVKALDIPVTDTAGSLPEDTPQWLRPYLTAAQRSGLIAGLPDADCFSPAQPITGAEAALMLQNALDLTLSDDALQTLSPDENIPDWAAPAMTVMSAYELAAPWDQPLTRSMAAKILYRAAALAVTAPGTAVFRLQN